MAVLRHDCLTNTFKTRLRTCYTCMNTPQCSLWFISHLITVFTQTNPWGHFSHNLFSRPQKHISSSATLFWVKFNLRRWHKSPYCGVEEIPGRSLKGRSEIEEVRERAREREEKEEKEKVKGHFRCTLWWREKAEPIYHLNCFGKSPAHMHLTTLPGSRTIGTRSLSLSQRVEMSLSADRSNLAGSFSS